MGSFPCGEGGQTVNVQRTLATPRKPARAEGQWEAGRPPANTQAEKYKLDPRCPSCQGRVEAWGRLDEAHHHAPGPCPRCGASVALVPAGIWD